MAVSSYGKAVWLYITPAVARQRRCTQIQLCGTSQCCWPDKDGTSELLLRKAYAPCSLHNLSHESGLVPTLGLGLKLGVVRLALGFDEDRLG